MNCVNAARGVRRMCVSEIMEIVATLLMGIATLASLVAADAAVIQDGAVALASLGVLGVTGLVGLVLQVVSLMLGITGLHLAGKDSREFKVAFFVAMAVLTLTVVNAAVSQGGHNGLLSSACEAGELAVILIVIRGVSQLLPESHLVKTGEVITMLAILTVIAEVTILLFGGNFPSFKFAVGVAGLVFAVASSVMFLFYLEHAKKELKQACAA